MESWKEIKAEIDREVEKTNLQPVEDVKEVFKYGICKLGAGVPDDNQIFTTWFFGGGDVSYLADWCYFLYNLSKEDKYDMKQLAKMMRYWVVQPSEFGNYCGMFTQWEFTKKINAILDTLTKEQFRELLDSYRAYLSNINVWVYYYYPWGLGAVMPVKDKKFYEEAIHLYDSEK